MQRISSTDLAKTLGSFEPAIAQGVVNVISVVAVRDRSGDRWPRKREAVALFVERAFERLAGPTGLLAPLNDTEFVTVQPDSSRAAALNLSLLVLRETLTFFLGEALPSDIRILQVRGYTEGELLVEDINAAALEQLSGARSGRDGTTPAPPAESPASPSGWQTVAGRGSLSVRYTAQPIWNIAQQVVAAYRLHAELSRGEATARDPLVELSEREAEDLAPAGLRQAAEWIGAALAAGSGCAVHVEISARALAAVGPRQRLAEQLHRLQAPIRRLLVLDIVDIGQVASAARLVELTAALKPLCRAVIIRMPGLDGEMSTWAQCRMNGVSVDCSDLDPNDSGALTRLAAIVERANAVSKAVIGYNLAARSLTLGAWAAGFTHVSGAAVHPDIASPLALRWNAVDLYADHRG